MSVMLVVIDGKVRGTAFFVSPDTALTAAHVVFGHGRVRLFAPREDGTYGLHGFATVDVNPRYADTGVPADDWAVLDCAREASDWLPVSNAMSRHAGWHADGFAEAFGEPLHPRAAQLVTLSGTVSKPGAEIQLQCLQALSDFKIGGASGSPIVVDGAAVGILCQGLKSDSRGSAGGVIFASALPKGALAERGVKVQDERRAVLVSPRPRVNLKQFELDPSQALRISMPGDAGWQREHLPGHHFWQEGLASIEEGVQRLKGWSAEVHIFATTSYGLGAVLGLRLADTDCLPEYYQADGREGDQRWVHYGRLKSGRTELNTISPDKFVPGQPVALTVSITHQIQPEQIAACMSGPYSVVASAAPEIGFYSVANSMIGQQIAYDLKRIFFEIDRRSKRAPVHLFYAGPLACLMMAAGALKTLGEYIIYAYYPDTQRYLPSIRICGTDVRVLP